MPNYLLNHPYNPFVMKPPDFNKLTQWYPELEFCKETKKLKVDADRLFRVMTYDNALSKVVMKEYFDLEFSPPINSLTPNVPCIMDHMLSIEETLHDTYGAGKPIRLLNVGNDASAIFPLLGAKYFKWNVVCTKSDQVVFDNVMKNVEINDLTSSIQVLKVEAGCLLSGALAELEDPNFDFAICSVPPIYLKGKRMKGAEGQKESLFMSEFIERLISDSFKVKEQIKLFFLKVKRAYFDKVKHLVRSFKCAAHNSLDVKYFRFFECIAWTFDESVTFARPHHQKKKKKSLLWVVPGGIRCLDVYDQSRLCEKLMCLFKGLRIPCEQEEDDEETGNKSLIITAHTNTWQQRNSPRDAEENGASDQEAGPVVDDGSAQPTAEAQNPRKKRNRRRSKAQKANGKANPHSHGDNDSKELDNHQQTPPAAQNCPAPEATSESSQQDSSSCRKRKASDSEACANASDQPEDCEPPAKVTAVECSPLPEQTCPNPSVPREESFIDCDEEDDEDDDDEDDEEDEEDDDTGLRPLLKGRVLVRMEKHKLCVEMFWICGTKEKNLFEVLQFVKQNLKYT